MVRGLWSLGAWIQNSVAPLSDQRALGDHFTSGGPRSPVCKAAPIQHLSGSVSPSSACGLYGVGKGRLYWEQEWSLLGLLLKFSPPPQS